MYHPTTSQIVVIGLLCLSFIVYFILRPTRSAWMRSECSVTCECYKPSNEDMNLIKKAPLTVDEMLFITTGQGDPADHEPRLREHIRNHIVKPSGRTPDLDEPNKGSDRSQVGQTKAIDQLLHGKRRGFFVECGAHDGELYSNTLFFELERDWTGLLIEANPQAHASLLKKHRNAFVLLACMSVTSKPSLVSLAVGGVGSQLTDFRDSHVAFSGPVMMVQCYPFNAIMDALSVTQIDYFSLDVERAELGILNTIDFQRFRIDLIEIEYACGSNPDKTLTRYAEYIDFFNKTGQRYGRYYEMAHILPKGSTIATGQDVVFKLKIQ